jgi:phospholipid transport system transporter-binding protein
MYCPTQSLTISNAGPALHAGLEAIASGQTEMDLAGLTQVDSAGVATLVAWQRAAQERKQSLVFRNLSHNLKSLAWLYGVADMLYAKEL